MANYEMICRHRTVFTEEELLQMDLAEEKDLTGIRRSYNLLNRNHWSLLSGTDSKMAKFKKVIDTLKKERKNISLDHQIALSQTKVKGDEALQAKIKEMLEENQDLTKKIKERKVELRETENEIRRTWREVEKLKKSQLTEIQLTQKKLEGTRIVEKLENRLDVQSKKFGLVTEENRKLKEEIDHLLKERANFNITWERAMTGMLSRKKCLLDLLQQATVTYNKRNDWVQTLNALRSKGYKDFQIDVEEIVNLQRTLNHQETLSKFMETKLQKRNMRQLDTVMEGKRRLENSRKKIQFEKYLSVLSDIQESTNLENIDAIVSYYYKQQLTNDSNFYLVSIINAEIEDLGKNLNDLTEKIKNQQEIMQKRQINEQLKLEKFAQRSEKLQADIAEMETYKKMEDNLLENVYNGILNIFKMIKCDPSPYLKLLGENHRINRYNVLLFLEAIQAKVYDMILIAIYKQKGERKREEYLLIPKDKFYPSPYDVDDIVSNNPCPLCVELEMVSDVIDTLQFAYTKDEIREKLNKRLELPDGNFRLHSVSHCNLPKSREIVQKRYQ